MAHSDDATKTWVKAIPKTNADGNVIEWNCVYKYTLAVASGKGNVLQSPNTFNDDFIHIFDEKIKINTPSKAPGSYTKEELLTLMEKVPWESMFNKKYTVHTATPVVETKDTGFDVNTLSDS